MKRRVPGLAQSSQPDGEVPDGVYLVSVVRLQYRWDKHKPYYALRLSVVEPSLMAGICVSARLYCTDRALWKLGWFLRDFGYDTELLSRDDIDEKAVIGLKGVTNVSHTTHNGRTYLNLDGFASAATWDELPLMPPPKRPASEVA